MEKKWACGAAFDPDNRKPLWWKEYTFQPETRNNIQPGIKTYDSVGFNQECFDFIKNWFISVAATLC